MSRKGRAKPNVAGERYDSNAIPIPGATTTARSNSNRTRPLPGFPADLLSGLGGMGGGMPDMGQMMDMMQKMGMGGGMGGMPGMMGGDGGIPGMPGMPGMMPPVAPALPKILYHNLPEGTPIDKLFTFYPTYINAKRTVQQGRRIIKEAACDDPLAVEMSEVCAFFNLPHVLEPGKKYARDWDVSGRIRVRLVNDNGSFTHPEIHTRKLF